MALGGLTSRVSTMLGRGTSAAAARRAARGGARAGAKKRLARMNRKRLMRAGMRSMLNSWGLDSERIARNPNSAAGGLLRWSGYNPNADYDVTLPSMVGPERVSKESNPTLGSLGKQLDGITRAAIAIGAISKEQQEQLIKQSKDAERAANEAKTEQVATQLSAPNVGESIGPGSDAISRLLAAIDEMSEKLNDAIREEQDRQAGGENAMWDYLGLKGVKQSRARARAQPKLRRGFNRLPSGQFVNTKTGQYVKAETALKNFKTVNPALLSTAARNRQAAALARPGIVRRGAIRVAGTVGRGATRVAGTVGRGAAVVAGTAAATKVKTAVSSSTARVAGAMRGGVRTASNAASKLAGPALTATIKRVARPLVVKGLAKTALKSIPLVGAAVGGLFAIGRLLQGDVVGAGLEAASGLGGPLTAIPALVLSLARDVYQGVFGVWPETDPQVGERMAAVKSGVEEIAKAQLASITEKEKPASRKAGDSVPSKAPKSDVQQRSQTAQRRNAPNISNIPSGSQPSSSGTQASPSTATGSSPSGSGASSTPMGGGTPSTPAPTATPAVPSSPVDQAPIPPDTSGTASPMEPTPTKSGAAIEAASGQAAAPIRAAGQMGAAPPTPSPFPTTKPNAKGMGNVPEPSYMGMGELVKSLYFGAVAGAMA